MIFKVDGDGRYRLTNADIGLEFHADHLRRDPRSGEIFGELSVATGLAGARTIDGVLSRGSFNFSSVPARKQRATILRERARTSKIDFTDHLEEFCLRIAEQERFGKPAVTLRDVERHTGADRTLDVVGLRFPLDHLSMVFGAGATLKSLLALRVCVEIARQGGKALFVDWELTAPDHAARAEAICGADIPEGIRYCHCDQPLVQDVDRLRRIIRADGITYAVLDSVAYGTHGDPGEAGPAIEYCRAIAQLGVGVLAIAHITKTGDQNDQMPYGSVFWHNSARMTWNTKRSDGADDNDDVTLGCFNRKSNLGPRQPPVGLRVVFDRGRVTFARTDLAAIDDMAEMLPLWQRIRQVVSRGPLPLHAIASTLNYDNVDTLDRTVRRYKRVFTKITGADGVHQIALVEMRSA